MTTVVLTGGVATGKSSLLDAWRSLEPELAHFDSDAAVHELLREAEVVGAVEEAFGPQVRIGGGIDRPQLREIVFHRADARRLLEGILHPRVRVRCEEARHRAEAGGVRLFVADVPLLYETGFDLARDYEIVVAASPATQLRRMCEQRGLEPELAARILAAQWPILRKVERASIVVWNEGTFSCLKRQAQYLSSRLASR